jgi:hypothetical protein
VRRISVTMMKSGKEKLKSRDAIETGQKEGELRS